MRIQKTIRRLAYGCNGVTITTLIQLQIMFLISAVKTCFDNARNYAKLSKLPAFIIFNPSEMA